MLHLREENAVLSEKLNESDSLRKKYMTMHQNLEKEL